MINDLHAHLFHHSWYPQLFQEAMVRDFLQRQRGSRKKAASPAMERQFRRLLSDDTGSSTIRIMDEVGIEKRVILVLDWGVELGEAEKSIWEIHRELLGICRNFSDRLIGFAGVDPRRPDATELLTFAFDELGARGLKLHPTGGWSLSEARTQDVVGLAAERKLPVLVHLGKTVDVLSQANAQPAPFIALARQFPQVPFIAGHSGFDLWRRFTERSDVPENIYFDISGWQERDGKEGTDILRDLEELNRAFPDRVCFGTDSPFYSFNLILSEKHWIQRVIPTLSGHWATLESWI